MSVKIVCIDCGKPSEETRGTTVPVFFENSQPPLNRSPHPTTEFRRRRTSWLKTMIHRIL